MRLVNSRRLIGPNFHLPRPAAIAEVSFETGEDVAGALASWRAGVTAALAGLGWPVELAVRRYDDAHGRPAADLVIAAPEDALLLAADIDEWAVGAARAGGPAPDPARELPGWRERAARAGDPRLDALRAAAAARDLPLLLDDEAASIGHGKHSMVWPIGQLPDPQDVPWDRLRRIPVALITGTNGKTTTARALARIARKAGLVPGNTSTDGLAIDERLVEEGDWTGPSAARTVLRRPEVELAALEVARGGILRRGLAIDRCDAAAITNIDADHLGDYGVHDLATMARVKAVVGDVVAPGGRVILGADSPPLVEMVRAGRRFPAPLVWFALRGDHPQIAEHRAAGGEAWFVSGARAIVRARGDVELAIVPLAEVPFCFGGAATHNVANALAAAALASALGLSDATIAAGLRAFSASFEDNPGRANVARVGGVHVFLDFAHNPAGIRGVRDVLTALRGPHRLLVCAGVAGDRRDEDIREVARALHELGADRICLRDVEHYLRGRELGEVPAIIRDELQRLGMPEEAACVVDSEMDALRSGLQWARPGDVIAILDHVDRDEIQAELRRLGATAGGGS